MVPSTLKDEPVTEQGVQIQRCTWFSLPHLEAIREIEDQRLRAHG